MVVRVHQHMQHTSDNISPLTGLSLIFVEAVQSNSSTVAIELRYKKK